MDKRILVIGFVLVAAAGGCSSSKSFTHPTKTTEDFKRESYECQVIAEQAHYARQSEAAKGLGILGAPLDALAIQDRVTECLQRKYGWRVVEEK